MPKDIDKSLQRLEKTESSQVFLAAVLVLLLAGFIVSMFFFSDIRNLYLAEMNRYTLDVLIVGLLLLSFWFVCYLAVKERAIRNLRNSLIKEKTARAVLENEREKLETLMEVGALLNSKVDRQIVFDTICAGIARCLKGDQSSLMLFFSRTGKLRCVSCYGKGWELLIGQEVSWGESVAGWMAQHRIPLLLSKDFDRHNFKNFIPKSREITSAICLPLELGGEIKGVLNVNLLEQQDRHFDEHDLRIARIFAQNAVLAIERIATSAIKIPPPAPVKS